MVAQRYRLWKDHRGALPAERAHLQGQLNLALEHLLAMVEADGRLDRPAEGDASSRSGGES